MERLVEQWADIPQNQRYAIVLGLVIAIVGGYWYFFHTAAVKKLENAESELLRLSQEKRQQVEYVARLAQYEAKFNQLQQDLNEARSQLPDDSDIPQLLAQLDNNARNSGLTIVKFQPKDEAPRDFYAEVGVEMQVKGSFHEIGTFVDAVGKMDRIVNVKDIRMREPSTENSKVVVDSEFSIVTYRFLENGKGKGKGKGTKGRGKKRKK